MVPVTAMPMLPATSWLVSPRAAPVAVRSAGRPRMTVTPAMVATTRMPAAVSASATAIHP